MAWHFIIDNIQTIFQWGLNVFLFLNFSEWPKIYLLFNRVAVLPHLCGFCHIFDLLATFLNLPPFCHIFVILPNFGDFDQFCQNLVKKLQNFRRGEFGEFW